jgi:aryl-alcohol dehydrogenase-like predicted oxidoreductase
VTEDDYPFGERTVRRIGLGAMRLTGPGVWGPPQDRAGAVALLRQAVEWGVDHIDTAQFYGPDVVNELIREALHPYPEGLALVSKVGVVRGPGGEWLPADRPEQLRAGVLDNLRSLGVERLAAVNLRLPERGPGEQPVGFDEQLDAMTAMREEGLISEIGLSNVSLDQVTYAAERTEITCVQNAFNVTDRSSEAVLWACARQGIAFVPFFPLGSAGGANPVLTHPGVVAAAGRLGATPAQVALAWCLEFAPNILLIPGTTSIAHLRENLDAATVALDREALAALDAA